MSSAHCSDMLTTDQQKNSMRCVNLTKRQTIGYDANAREIMELEKQTILSQIKLGILRGTSFIHDNQRQMGSTLTSMLMDRKLINIMIVALTQSGKTGCMIALIKYYLHHPDNTIPIENIYILTSLSSKAWMKQTKSRMPDSLQDRVYHRNNLTTKFVEDIKGKQNCLVIMDEIQIAAKKGQTLNKTFEKACFYDLQFLLKNDIKIIEFTATPDGTIYDVDQWGEHSAKITMEPGEGYTSCFDLLKSGRVKEYKDLCSYDKKTEKCDHKITDKNITEIKTDIDGFQKPMYHIIRTPNDPLSKEVIANFKRIFGNDMEYSVFNSQSETVYINDILKNTPATHTFIFIKETLRCAITLNKTNLGILYERRPKTSPHDSTMMQGLLGRNTGYDDNGISIVFTNGESIEKYKELWDSGFDVKTVKWKSKTTKFKNNKLSSKNTFVSPIFVDGLEIKNDGFVETNNKIPTIKFKNQDDAGPFFKELGKCGYEGSIPQKKHQNSDGFYLSTIKKEEKVWSHAEIAAGLYIGSSNNNYRYFPCYKDPKAQSTLEWWLILDHKNPNVKDAYEKWKLKYNKKK